MKEIRLHKGNGKVRIVYAPSRRQKRRYRRLLPLLMRAERQAARAAGVAHVAHGFVEGRSPVTCARQHMGMAVTVCCDLAGWFDSVRHEQIVRGLELAGADTRLAGRVCWLGAPRQGLPTSPAAANLAAVEMDRRIVQDLGFTLTQNEWAYTRYADDLSVSLRQDTPGDVAWVLIILDACARWMGWEIAAGKTRVQRARAGRRVIVGVSVGDADIRPTRKFRRKLRAATHNDPDSADVRGMNEWDGMKLPRAARPSRVIAGTGGGGNGHANGNGVRRNGNGHANGNGNGNHSNGQGPANVTGPSRYIARQARR